MVKTTWPKYDMETNHENINNHCNNRTTAHISHKHVHSTLQTTLIQMMLFVWVTPQRCGRKVDRTLCLCIYGKECRIDRTLYSTLLNSTHFFSVVDRTPTHYFWSTGWEVISKSPSHYSMLWIPFLGISMLRRLWFIMNFSSCNQLEKLEAAKSAWLVCLSLLGLT